MGLQMVAMRPLTNPIGLVGFVGSRYTRLSNPRAAARPIHRLPYPAAVTFAGAAAAAGGPPTPRRPAPYDTALSRGLGRYSRPTLPPGRPSYSTTSAVKSFAPRIRDEPTP